MDKLLIICGQTATGKTKLGIKLARKINGEIISADSRQVYRGMTIGTGKEIGGGKWEMSREVRCGKWVVDGIPIWLTDVVEPDYRFNVADYKKCADVVLDDISRRGKLPILVGGTGFYIKAITEEIGTIGMEPDWELRRELQNCKVPELQRMLEDLDPEPLGSARGKLRRRMNESDRQNPRRLIRAIEIARKCKVQSSKCKVAAQSSKFDKFFIGLTAPYNILYQRIDQRVDERVKNGLEDEIRKLLAKGYTWGNSAMGTTLAYREWRDYFDGGKSREEAIQRWKFDEHEYARRQMTWFKKALRQACTEPLDFARDKLHRSAQGNWFDITKEDWQEKVEKLVESWYD